MSKYTEEIKVWFEQQENRYNSCYLQVKSYREQIRSLGQAIRLEYKQAKLIRSLINKTKQEWNFGKENKK